MKTPNPGSSDALAAGCTCAVLDNAHGKGFYYPRDDGLDPNLHPSFYVTEGCPLHWPASTDTAGKDEAP